MSLCTNALSISEPAAARASHFFLHVIMELEFGFVGQLHGPVFQFSAGRGKHFTSLPTQPATKLCDTSPFTVTGAACRPPHSQNPPLTLQ